MSLVSGCRPTNEYHEPPPPDVTVAKPLVREVTVYLEETGTTEAVERVEVHARVSGFLQEILFQPNDDVTQGDVLFKIEPEEFLAKRDLAKAEVRLAEVAKAKAENDLARQKEVFEKGAVSEMTMVRLQAEVDGSAAQIDAANARLSQAQLDVDYTEVQSPITGRIGKSLVKMGNLVSSQPSTHLATIVSNDAVYANFTISEQSYLSFVDAYDPQEKNGRDVPLYLARASDEGFPYQGTLNFTDLTVEQGTGTFAIRGLFPNSDGRLTPGLFVRIRFPVDRQKDALLIPDRATAVDQAGSYVLVVNSENMVERRDVVVGAKFGPMVVISAAPNAEEPITAEDRIVVDGVQRSRPGAVVNPVGTELTVDESLLNPEKGTAEKPAADEVEKTENSQ
ncbi:efflux RND transporter periplasmic adaptor subunit [Blastopirellula sp. JC732]|uniref:Efflux RND transporter periplasmic adaptor subunit n=1 Tax=Blastopirellula sediminis TaxID=2894196 RepID=A0A9X1MLP1_9BACT|nr:efflux RND transporter periplasmic adaptor subunit [Blastopirellula sediminis]MCC9609424.1 efflux RND transporter periplasmic adaptor subunit [Blastopirellula sediminis]MCC9627799.1 efflux RND transporter periplasmic adaptor subunit [Blastopirellula sediminis]